MGGFDVKLVAFRASMIALALPNVLLVLDSVNANRGVINGAVMATAAFQVRNFKSFHGISFYFRANVNVDTIVVAPGSSLAIVLSVVRG